MANRPTRLRLGLLLGFAIAVLLPCEIQPASARDGDTQSGWERFTSLMREVNRHAADANALASNEASDDLNRIPARSKIGIGKGPVLRRLPRKDRGQLGTRLCLVRKDERSTG